MGSFSQSLLIALAQSVIAFAILGHTPRIKEITQMWELRIRVFSELTAYGNPIAAVPYLLVKMLAFSGGNAPDRGFATASAH